ncbi:ABC transporter permease [Brucellaceae bacterium C25G]
MNSRNALFTACVFSSVLVLWWLASTFGWVNAFLLPSPVKVMKTLIELAQSGTLKKHTLISMQRVGLGYAGAVFIAITLAVLFSFSHFFRRLLDPLIEFMRQVPPLALMPLLILWLGIGEAQKVGIIILACFFPIFLGVRGGIEQVDHKLIEVGKVAGLNRAEIMWRIILPCSLPAIVIGLRIGLGYSWRALVGAELIASSAGLGYLIVDAENLARTDIVLVGILVIGIIGLIADMILKKLIGFCAPWLKKDLENARA